MAYVINGATYNHNLKHDAVATTWGRAESNTKTPEGFSTPEYVRALGGRELRP